MKLNHSQYVVSQKSRRLLSRRFLDRRFLGRRFLGRRFLGRLFLGRRFLDTSHDAAGFHWTNNLSLQLRPY